MRLLLHIGCEKTGTTSLQHWLDQNAGALASRGIVYSQALGRPNNRRISHYGLEPGSPDEILGRDGVRTPEQYAALQARIGRDLTAEVVRARASGCATFVISNEHCHSRLKTEASVTRVHDLLAPLFDAIRVYCVLRPQIDSCLSLASSIARFGGAVSREWVDRQMRPAAKYYALDQLLQRWAAVFGREAVAPVAFRRCPNSIDLFEQQLGVADARLPRRPAANHALDYRVIALVNAMNAGRAERGGDRSNALLVDPLPLEQRLTLDRASAQALQARFDASNAALCARWPQITEADLTPDWAGYPETGNIDRLHVADEVGPMLRLLVERLRDEALAERARLLGMTSERDLALERPEAALLACREALVLARAVVPVGANRRSMEALIVELEQRERQIEAAAAV